MKKKHFFLMRERDISGISGTGLVAEVFSFENGKAAVAWLGNTPSVVIYDSLSDVEKIHGHGGATYLVGATPDMHLGGTDKNVS